MGGATRGVVRPTIGFGDRTISRFQWRICHDFLVVSGWFTIIYGGFLVFFIAGWTKPVVLQWRRCVVNQWSQPPTSAYFATTNSVVYTVLGHPGAAPTRGWLIVQHLGFHRHGVGSQVFEFLQRHINIIVVRNKFCNVRCVNINENKIVDSFGFWRAMKEQVHIYTCYIIYRYKYN